MAKKNEKLNYKDAIESLNEIVNKLKQDEVSVDTLVEDVKKAKELLAYCKEVLRKTDEELDKIVE